MRVKSRSLMLGLALLAPWTNGCAFSPVKRTPIKKYSGTFAKTHTVELGYVESFRAVREALSAMGYSVQAESTALGVVRTAPVSMLAEGICDCGTWNGSHLSGPVSSMITVGITAQTATRCTIGITHQCVAAFHGRNLKGSITREESYECASMGRVENNFWLLLQRFCSTRPATAGAVPSRATISAVTGGGGLYPEGTIIYSGQLGEPASKPSP